jgi:hypothetical protein
VSQGLLSGPHLFVQFLKLVKHCTSCDVIGLAVAMEFAPRVARAKTRTNSLRIFDFLMFGLLRFGGSQARYLFL